MQIEGIGLLYLDHQASTSMHPDVKVAMQSAMADFCANPHSTEHAAGWAAADAIEVARSQIAAAINADADEIVFTSGATEANNLAILGTANGQAGRRRIIVSAIEHKSVLGPARELFDRGYEVHVAPVTSAGIVDVHQLADLIDERTLIVSCMAVNNEIGTVQPIEGVAALCRNAGALFHVDAAQALAWAAIDTQTCDADLISLSAHKAGGPQGVGGLFVRREVRSELRPLFYGGEQEDGLRPGTLPTFLCIGFGAACAHLPTTAEIQDWRLLTAGFERRLVAAIPGLRINGDGERRHPGAISVTLPDVDAEALVMQLQPDLAVSRSSACTSGIREPSHVLTAIGLDNAACDRTIRFGIGRYTTEGMLDGAFERLLEVLPRASSGELAA